jgi:diaminopimelate decarboxylase
VLRTLHKQFKQAPVASEYVAPAFVRRSDADEQPLHAARARVVTDVVAAAVAQRIVHDDSPLANLFNWNAYTARLENLRSAFPEPAFTHALAVKSNPIRGVLREAQRLGMGAECASFGEAKHALSLGFAPRRVVYDSPCKTLNELKEMITDGVFVNLDNEEEIAKVNRVFAAIGGFSQEAHGAQFGLRINPIVGGGTIDATSTATVTSKFGLAWTQATSERLYQLYEQNPWLQGVHVHVGSQGCPIDLLVAGAQRAVEFAKEVNRRVGRQQILAVDIGGGVPTVYDGGAEEAYDFHQYADALHAQVPELFTSGFTSIITEFGRAVFVKPGITVTKIEALKNWAGQNILVTHVGADQFPRAAYLPKLWSHVISVLDRNGHEKNAAYARQDVAGPLCFSGDFLVKQMYAPQADIGDWAVIHDTGGYTVSMFSKFNSRQAAPIYAYRKTETGAFQFTALKERESVTETLAFWGIDKPVEF